ncbi:MAG: peroxidase [Methylomonas sp.]|jgi:deferrochelatase/peroxidase EfeB|uniref:Dyp-type peroxidase n=1 Tax=Methylomonas sp. TaxID=418 RepID=UPI0025D39B70|nr:peroxidase [Methylomonas sp.]MCK9606445.1 peroxidase [Methylomonas sp.]
MTHSSDFQFDDLQGLLRFGHGRLRDSCFLLLNVADQAAAKQWLGGAPITRAIQTSPPPKTALQIAFSVAGLRALGLKESVIRDFSDEFISGMSGNESRSRRLGDVGANAPEYWEWGGNNQQVPHMLLLLYAEPGKIAAWRKKVETKLFVKAFQLLAQLPTQDIGDIEPFGFVDGISQPNIDWAAQQTLDSHQRDSFSNLLAVGEVVLGYRNEYKQYTVRPLIDPGSDPGAAELPPAEEQPELKDFARNGSYLVLRQLGQDVPGFWQFLDNVSGGDAAQREQLAASMVGRRRDGSPLLPPASAAIPGIAADDHLNRFNYLPDPGGTRCPIGAHVRRANPRTGDMPSVSGCFFSRLLKILGFGLKRYDEDLIASTRFHRLLRRGRAYGPLLTPEQAVKADAPVAERGLQFICLVANISRQFEFVQNAWVVNGKFAGLQQERDPLLAHRQPLNDGTPTDQFHRPDAAGPTQTVAHLPQFISVRGGAYFFMPGLSAIRYLAALPHQGDPSS